MDRRDVAPDAPASRALLLWPRLDRARLARAKGDPERIARLVARRTSLSPQDIVALLRRDADAD